MDVYGFTLGDAALEARLSGALWWRARRLLVVSDLHLGRALRPARRGGAMLPPYEVSDTLARLDAEIARLEPECVICLGDSFDDLGAEAELPARESQWLSRLMAGRRWVWIEGNHDPGPVALGGEHRAELREGALTFRHVAQPGAAGEVSGHYHPKARLAGVAQRCFLVDRQRAILPAFGAYTGGLRSEAPAFAALMGPDALALLLGDRILPVPMAKASPRSSMAS